VVGTPGPGDAGQVGAMFAGAAYAGVFVFLLLWSDSGGEVSE